MQILNDKAKNITGVTQTPYRVVSRALEVIPRTLIQNCGGNTIRTLTALRAKHATGDNKTWGIDGETGEIVDMKTLGVWEPLAVKLQAYKTAIEVSFWLDLRGQLKPFCLNCLFHFSIADCCYST